MLSFTEENYLKCIYKLAESKHGDRVSTNAIAEQIQSSAASVSDMLKKLADKQLIEYKKYKGVILSDTGKEAATQLIRKHRLWECFLVNKLSFDWHEVHEIAEELEHIKSDELINRLDNYLGNPKFDPHGDPIPTASGKFTMRQQKILSKINPGQQVVVLGVLEHSTKFLTYLNQLNIQIGTEFTVQDRNDFDQSIQIAMGAGNPILLTQRVCEKLLVNEV